MCQLSWQTTKLTGIQRCHCFSLFIALQLMNLYYKHHQGCSLGENYASLVTYCLVNDRRGRCHPKDNWCGCTIQRGSIPRKLEAAQFLEHSFVKRDQATSYQENWEVVESMNFDPKLALCYVDFFENFTCIAQDEFQSFYWVQPQSLFRINILEEEAVLHVSTLCPLPWSFLPSSVCGEQYFESITICRVGIKSGTTFTFLHLVGQGTLALLRRKVLFLGAEFTLKADVCGAVNLMG
ncbi:hypothetical protein PR048_013304 [Dryococelus australis]|uniref:Uncharacterized protein n=1 Tax=Dryococelus australis TaxID=614101 RepID=A0ABQ9HRS5_9NEOP|nr:hypothetical protein PR048_013304 [Dryococelus australis]